MSASILKRNVTTLKKKSIFSAFRISTSKPLVGIHYLQINVFFVKMSVFSILFLMHSIANASPSRVSNFKLLVSILYKVCGTFIMTRATTGCPQKIYLKKTRLFSRYILCVYSVDISSFFYSLYEHLKLLITEYASVHAIDIDFFWYIRNGSSLELEIMLCIISNVC